MSSATAHYVSLKLITQGHRLFLIEAIRKHPYGDEANDWEGVCIPSPIRAQEGNFACCGRSFRPEGRGLNQQGKLIKPSIDIPFRKIGSAD
jgi:hypothetical protein